MAISRNLAELMGGTLSIESKLGTGTTPTLMLDLESANAPSLASVGTSMCAGPMASKAAFGNKEELPWILVVDDNKLNRDVLLRQINSLGYPTDSVASGGEALGLLRHRNYAVILNECRCPAWTGTS